MFSVSTLVIFKNLFYFSTDKLSRRIHKVSPTVSQGRIILYGPRRCAYFETKANPRVAYAVSGW